MNNRNDISYSHLKSEKGVHERYQYLINKSADKSKIPHPSLYDEYIHEIKPPKSLVFHEEFSIRSGHNSPSKTTWKPDYSSNKSGTYSPTRDWKHELLSKNDREYLKNPPTSIPKIVDKYQLKSNSSIRPEIENVESSEKIHINHVNNDEISENRINNSSIVQVGEINDNIKRLEKESSLNKTDESFKNNVSLEMESHEKEEREQELINTTLKDGDDAKEIQREKQKEALEQEAERDKVIIEKNEEVRPKELETEERKQAKDILNEKRTKEEQQKKENELDPIDQLANDPMMLKYMQIVNEKRGFSGKSEAKMEERKSSSSESFGIGGTEDEMSAPGGDSSSGPSW